jgi:hypothetical protein
MRVEHSVGVISGGTKFMGNGKRYAGARRLHHDGESQSGAVVTVVGPGPA